MTDQTVPPSRPRYAAAIVAVLTAVWLPVQFVLLLVLSVLSLGGHVMVAEPGLERRYNVARVLFAVVAVTAPLGIAWLAAWKGLRATATIYVSIAVVAAVMTLPLLARASW